jgi:hypothetical protein
LKIESKHSRIAVMSLIALLLGTSAASCISQAEAFSVSLSASQIPMPSTIRNYIVKGSEFAVEWNYQTVASYTREEQVGLTIEVNVAGQAIELSADISFKWNTRTYSVWDIAVTVTGARVWDYPANIPGLGTVGSLTVKVIAASVSVRYESGVYYVYISSLGLDVSGSAQVSFKRTIKIGWYKKTITVTETLFSINGRLEFARVKWRIGTLNLWYQPKFEGSLYIRWVTSSSFNYEGNVKIH